jgi:hypothetical protein
MRLLMMFVLALAHRASGSGTRTDAAFMGSTEAVEMMFYESKFEAMFEDPSDHADWLVGPG